MTIRNPELTAYRQGLHEATITERARVVAHIREAAGRIEALEAENERLRGALRDVTDYGDLAAVRIARAALEARHDR